jgi:hypothetical protein
MSTITSPHRRLDQLIDGQVLGPDDRGWDAARTAWQLNVDQHPAAVVVPRSVADILQAVVAARAAGLRVAPQATGHNAGPLGPLDDTVLLRTSALDGVMIDGLRRVARVEAGTVWGAVTDAAAEFGLAALAGSARDVGVVGYTLGGGLSWFARSHGLAANHVLAAEIVTTDGVLRRVDADHDPDLFWAIRGGGGSFGVVTALEFRLFPIMTVQAGALFWPLERAAEVLHGWRTWLTEVPDSVTSVGRILRFPPAPQIPEPMRGRSLVTVEIVAQLDATSTRSLLAPLRELSPEIDTLRATPVSELGTLHMDPPGPTPATGDGLLLDELTPSALDAYLASVGPEAETPFLTTELRHLGGALRNPLAGMGAVSSLGAEFALYSGAITPDARSREAAVAALDALAVTLSPWTAGSSYANFAERPQDGRRLFGVDAHRRLRAIKTAYDPEDVIRANHPVVPNTTQVPQSGEGSR